MKKINKIAFTTVACLFTASQAFAEMSATVGITSDYLFNGVSQTDKGAAVQGSLDWSNDQGWYAGAWGSNVDFGDSTDTEVDFYIGYNQDLNDEYNLDVSFLHYSYHGGGGSSDINYSELAAALSRGNTSLGLWYAWDYAGTGAGHYVVKLTHLIELQGDVGLELMIDRSASLDGDKFTWEPGDKDYWHYAATVQFQMAGFDLAVGVESTDLDTYGDTTVVAKVSRTFSF